MFQSNFRNCVTWKIGPSLSTFSCHFLTTIPRALYTKYIEIKERKQKQNSDEKLFDETVQSENHTKFAFFFLSLFTTIPRTVYR